MELVGVIIPNFYLYTSELARKTNSYQAKSAIFESGALIVAIQHSARKIGEQKLDPRFPGGGIAL